MAPSLKALYLICLRHCTPFGFAVIMAAHGPRKDLVPPHESSSFRMARDQGRAAVQVPHLPDVRVGLVQATTHVRLNAATTGAWAGL